MRDLDLDLVREVVNMPDSHNRNRLLAIAKTSFYQRKIQTCYTIEEDKIIMAITPHITSIQ
jgi:hypothetical protein